MLFSIAVNSLEEANFDSQKSKHPMSFAWSLQPMIGIFGTFVNSFVLYMGYCERATFIRPVNAIIWYVPVDFSALLREAFNKKNIFLCHLAHWL